MRAIRATKLNIFHAVTLRINAAGTWVIVPETMIRVNITSPSDVCQDFCVELPMNCMTLLLESHSLPKNQEFSAYRLINCEAYASNMCNEETA